MSVSAATLRELHRIHLQLTELRGRLRRGPMVVQARKEAFAKLQQENAAAHETLKAQRMASDRKQLDLKASEDRIANWRVNLNAASSNKEYQTLQEQIAAAEMATSVLSDEILELMERIDELEQEANRSDDNLATAKQELVQFAKTTEEQAAGLRSEIDRLEGELADAEKPLSGDLKTEYQRVIRNKGADGMAAAEDRVCTGCGQQITINQQSDLALSRPVFCGSCGCLLYLPE